MFADFSRALEFDLCIGWGVVQFDLGGEWWSVFGCNFAGCFALEAGDLSIFRTMKGCGFS